MNYHWIDPDGQKILHKNRLIFTKSLNRSNSGNYTCIAKNKHGEVRESFLLTVLFKPNCTVSAHEENDMLICEADGSPQKINYIWEIKLPNETDSRPLKGGIMKNGKSYMKIRNDIEGEAIYKCLSNNTVGFGEICEIEIIREKEEVTSNQAVATSNIFIILLAFIITFLG